MIRPIASDPDCQVTEDGHGLVFKLGQYASRTIEAGPMHYFDFFPSSLTNSVTGVNEDPSAVANGQIELAHALLPRVEACVSTTLTLGPPGALYIGFTHDEL